MIISKCIELHVRACLWSTLTIRDMRALLFIFVCVHSIYFNLNFHFQIVHHILALLASHNLFFGLFWVKFALEVEILFQLNFILRQLHSKFSVNFLQTRLNSGIQASIREDLIIDFELFVESQRQFTAPRAQLLLSLPP